MLFWGEVYTYLYLRPELTNHAGVALQFSLMLEKSKDVENGMRRLVECRSSTTKNKNKKRINLCGELIKRQIMPSLEDSAGLINLYGCPRKKERNRNLGVAGVARCWCRSPSGTLTWPAVSDTEASIRRIAGPTTSSVPARWASQNE